MPSMIVQQSSAVACCCTSSSVMKSLSVVGSVVVVGDVDSVVVSFVDDVSVSAVSSAVVQPAPTSAKRATTARPTDKKEGLFIGKITMLILFRSVADFFVLKKKTPVIQCADIYARADRHALFDSISSSWHLLSLRPRSSQQPFEGQIGAPDDGGALVYIVPLFEDLDLYTMCLSELSDDVVRRKCRKAFAGTVLPAPRFILVVRPPDLNSVACHGDQNLATSRPVLDGCVFDGCAYSVANAQWRQDHVEHARRNGVYGAPHELQELIALVPNGFRSHSLELIVPAPDCCERMSRLCRRRDRHLQQSELSEPLHLIAKQVCTEISASTPRDLIQPQRHLTEAAIQVSQQATQVEGFRQQGTPRLRLQASSFLLALYGFFRICPPMFFHTLFSKQSSEP